MSRFSTIQQSGVTVLRVTGVNFDSGVTPAFLAAVAAINPEHPPVVVDLSAVQFIDSSGLGALCALARHVNPQSVNLAGASARLMARLSAMFGEKPRECHETLVDAIAACQATEGFDRDDRSHSMPWAEHVELV